MILMCTCNIKYAFNRELNLVCKQIDYTDSLGMEQLQRKLGQISELVNLVWRNVV